MSREPQTMMATAPRALRLAIGGLLTFLSAALLLAACADSADAPEPAAVAAPPTASGKVHVLAPTGPPRVPTSLEDARGAPVTLACSSCHGIKTPNPERRHGEDLALFHQGLTTRHGELTCLSCHDARDYDSLRLVDLTPVPFTDLKALCRQCHGPQVRDYDHGSHGGMTGYWDLSRGDRVRNGCTSCHDPHAPAYVGMLPAPGPQDRVMGAGPHDHPPSDHNRQGH